MRVRAPQKSFRLPADGHALTRRAIRANPDWARERIIMLTAGGCEVERVKGMALGADAYITSPFSTREVVERVRHHLGDTPV